MTFKELKQGYPVFILDKDNLELKQGKVVNTTFPRIDTQPTGTKMVVDVTLDMGGKNAVYTMPEDAAVVYANSLVLSTEQQCLAVEVEKMKTDAERVLSTVERQKKIISVADDLLAQLNPNLKDKKETEERFNKVENSIGELKDMIKSLVKELKG